MGKTEWAMWANEQGVITSFGEDNLIIFQIFSPITFINYVFRAVRTVFVQVRRRLRLAR